MTVEADALAKELAANKKMPPTKDSAALVQKALAHLRASAFTDAEPLLRKLLDASQEQDPDIWATFQIQSLLGVALLGQKKYADAEPFLVAGYEGMWQRATKIPAKERDSILQQAIAPLAELFEATRDREETKHKGKLTDDRAQGIHEIKLTAGKPVVIQMRSKEFDSLLQLKDAKGKLLAESNDIDFAAKELDSRLVFLPKTDAVCQIVAGSYTGRGEYEIIIHEYYSATRKK
jgi:hypothetical protein